jgi:hypothetical protein
MTHLLPRHLISVRSLGIAPADGPDGATAAPGSSMPSSLRAVDAGDVPDPVEGILTLPRGVFCTYFGSKPFPTEWRLFNS